MDCNKITTKNSISKIPTSLTSFNRSASVRIRGHKANLSSSLPSAAAGDLGQHMKANSWRADCEPLSLNTKKISSSSKFCFDDDLESVGSIASNFSVATANSICEHTNFAKNGTTYSGRSHKYIVHCSTSWNNEEEYLTPTQRANRSIRKLKTLLQLAREKLREKEEEIFKLNKEVVELKSGTKVLNSPIQNSANTFSEKVQNLPLLTGEKFCDFSSIKHLAENVHHSKISPAKPQDNIEDKSMTPDFLFSSMVDSGNFDDLTSLASVYSKDSSSFVNSSDPKNLHQDSNFQTLDTSNQSDKVEIIKMFEKKLEDKKLEYETELKKVLDNQEEKNIKMICDFESRLKDEEMKFESRWSALLISVEEEKLEIVKRFEKKLEEEKEKYKESLKQYTAQNDFEYDVEFEKSYSKNVTNEKNLYETSLLCMKQKFEAEKCLIEKKFDDSILEERQKFENNLKLIKEKSDLQIYDLTHRISELESEYSNLLPKYENALSQSEKLEEENLSLKNKLKEQEENYKKMFLTIYKKGQEAAKLDLVSQESEPANSNMKKKISISELFAQLKITEAELENLKDKEYRAAHSNDEGLCLLSSKEAISLWLLAARKAMYKRLAEVQQKHSNKDKGGSDPEATLQFLKSAVYYFLTDRENHMGHLKAIESILGFSSAEKSNIENVYLSKYY